MQLKPMENVFIGMVRKLNEELHKVSKVDAETVTEIKTKLDQHLAKAQKHQMLLYEGETHNVLAIYHVYHGDNQEDILDHLNQAQICAKDAENTDLLIRTLSTTGGVKMLAHDYDGAVSSYQEIIRVSETLKQAPIYLMNAYLNIAGNLMRKGSWDDVQLHIDAFYEAVNRINLTSDARQTYARAMYYARLSEVQVALAKKRDKTVLSDLRLTEELATQLNADYVKRYKQPLEQLHLLFSNHDKDAFIEWYEQSKVDNATNVIDHSAYACILHERGYDELAIKLAKDVLDITPNDSVRDAIQQDFADFGIVIS
ncbi:MAG: hypothetical protein AAF846_30170 [Chloroflexota bacterium]